MTLPGSRVYKASAPEAHTEGKKASLKVAVQGKEILNHKFISWTTMVEMSDLEFPPTSSNSRTSALITLGSSRAWEGPDFSQNDYKRGKVNLGAELESKGTLA